MIESEGGVAVEEEDEHNVEFVVFTPGLLIRAHHSAACTFTGPVVTDGWGGKNHMSAFCVLNNR